MLGNDVFVCLPLGVANSSVITEYIFLTKPPIGQRFICSTYNICSAAIVLYTTAFLSLNKCSGMLPIVVSEVKLMIHAMLTV